MSLNHRPHAYQSTPQCLAIRARSYVKSKSYQDRTIPPSCPLQAVNIHWIERRNFAENGRRSTLSGVAGALERNDLLSVGPVPRFQLLREQARRLGRIPDSQHWPRAVAVDRARAAPRLRLLRAPRITSHARRTSRFANADGSSCKGQMEWSDPPGAVAWPCPMPIRPDAAQASKEGGAVNGLKAQISIGAPAAGTTARRPATCGTGGVPI